MSISKGKIENKGALADQMIEQAKRLDIPLVELKKLAEGKSCPKYGVTELLHARKTRNGKIAVFNISERFRGEKISTGRKLLTTKKAAPIDPPVTE